MPQLTEDDFAVPCFQCGANPEEVVTNLPFKISRHAIVIVKQLPVLQCERCSEYLLEDSVMERVDLILEDVPLLIEVDSVPLVTFPAFNWSFFIQKEVV